MNYLEDMTIGELAQVTKALQLEPEGNAEEAVGSDEEPACEQN